MKKKLLIVAGLLMMVGALTGCLNPSSTTTTAAAASTGTTTTINGSASTSLVTSVSGLETTLETIYSQVSPSVVLINDNMPASSTSLGGPALGSGFVWDTKGDIVTNNHVIDGASNITVTFSDGTVGKCVIGGGGF